MFGKDKKNSDVETSTRSTAKGPTVGDEVAYFLADRENPEGPPVARVATVTHVHNATCVDLDVVTAGERDGLNDLVQRHSVTEGTGVGHWAWPAKK